MERQPKGSGVALVVGLALVAAVVTGCLEQQMLDELKSSFFPRKIWNHAAFIVLVPAAFGAVSLVVRTGWPRQLSLVGVAAAASLAMAYVAGLDVVDSLDRNDAVEIAMRAWYGLMYLGAGMLLPLSVALRQAMRSRPETPDPAV